jgi:hypothetical protein
MDQISNFTINAGAGPDDDVLDFSAVSLDAAFELDSAINVPAANYAAVATAANLALDAAVKEVQTFTLGNDLGDGTADGSVELFGVTLSEGVEIVDGANADQIGTAFVAAFNNDATAFTGVESLTYNAGTDVLTATFLATAGNVAQVAETIVAGAT